MGSSANTRRGWLRVLTIDDPAAGGGFQVTEGLAYRLRIIGVRFRLVTDANVANRRVSWGVNYGGNVGAFYICNTTQAASLTYYYNFVAGYGAQDFLVVDNVNVPIGLGFEINDYVRLDLGVNGVRVGDQCSQIAVYCEQWIEDYFT